jgi:uncharacterized protein YbaA (DUF1428 family)
LAAISLPNSCPTFSSKSSASASSREEDEPQPKVPNKKRAVTAEQRRDVVFMSTTYTVSDTDDKTSFLQSVESTAFATQHVGKEGFNALNLLPLNRVSPTR